MLTNGNFFPISLLNFIFFNAKLGLQLNYLVNCTKDYILISVFMEDMYYEIMPLLR